MSKCANPTLGQELRYRASDLTGVDLAQPSAAGTLNNWKERGLELLEISQYTVLYALAVIFFASLIDKAFPEYDASMDSAAIAGLVVAQLVVIAIAVYFIRRLVRMIPFVGFKAYDCYNPEAAPENVDIIVGVLLMTVQPQLLAKVQHVGRAISAAL